MKGATPYTFEDALCDSCVRRGEGFRKFYEELARELGVGWDTLAEAKARWEAHSMGSAQ